MENKKNRRLNWNLILLIILTSSGLGFTIDVFLGYNNYTFLISFGLPILLFLIFNKHFYILRKKEPSQKEKSVFKKITIWKYKLWSYIGFYLASMGIWSLIKIVIDKIEYIKLNYDEWYISIVLATIIMSVKGDKILYWWFRIQSITKIFEYKKHLINQNNVRLYIYIGYLIILFITYSGVALETNSLWINTFATYIAFDSVRSNWHLLRNEEFLSV